MKTLSRHLALHVLGFSAIVALVLVAIYTFISFVIDIDSTQGGFGVRELLLYSLLMMPSGLYTLMPIVALLGTLLGLGALAAQNEITAMRAAGFSVLQIGRAALFAGLLLGGLQMLLGDVLGPMGVQAARSLRAETRDSSTALSTRPIWLRDGDAVVHIGELLAEDRARAFSVYRLDAELRLQSALRAETAQYRAGRWELGGVVRTHFGEAAVDADRVEQLSLRLQLSPEVLRLFVLEANSLDTPGLRKLIAYLDANGLDARAYRLSLWRKLVAPVTVVAMMLLAVPFVLGSQRGGGAGQRILIGVLLGLGFYVVNEVTASTGQLFGWHPLLAAGLPTAALGVLALLRLVRAR